MRSKSTAPKQWRNQCNSYQRTSNHPVATSENVTSNHSRSKNQSCCRSESSSQSLRGQEQTRTAPDHNDQSSHSSRTNPDLRRAKQKAKRHVKIIKDVVRQCRLRDLAEDGSVMGTIEGRLPK